MTLQCLQPQYETTADILFAQDMLLLKLAGQPIDEVEALLLPNGYKFAPEDSAVYLWAADHIRDFLAADIELR